MIAVAAFASQRWAAGMLASVPIGESGRIICPTRGYGSRVVRLILDIRRAVRVVESSPFGPYEHAFVLDGNCRIALCPVHWLSEPTSLELARCRR